MSTTSLPTHPASWSRDPRKVSLDRRLAGLFWALLLILVGTLWLVPAERIPDGTWLVGFGLILLALNAARLLNRIPVRVLPTVLGALALCAGLAEYAGAELPLLPLTLIAIGAGIALELFPARERGGDRSRVAETADRSDAADA